MREISRETQWQGVRLFEGLSYEEVVLLLRQLKAHPKKYKKGEYVLAAGEKADYIGVVLAGQLGIVKEDADGGRAFLAQIGPGGHFAETLCCTGVQASPVSAMAETDASVLLLGYAALLRACAGGSVFHTRLVENMLRVVAEKNLYLQQRMEYVGQKNLRRRVLQYLRGASAGSKEPFTIPYSREEMADYLCADRSALSRELSRLQHERVIDYRKNSFRLL